MAYTDQQITEYAYKLQDKGAPMNEIEEFVRLAREEQTTAQPEKTFGQKALSATGSALKGVAKYAGSAVAGASALGEKILSFGQAENTLGEQFQKSETLKPQNTAEQVGFLAGEIASFFLPAGVAGKAVKGAEVAIGASKLSKGAKLAGKIATNAAVEGATGAGVTALQSGGDMEKTKDAALTGAAFGTVGRGASEVMTPIKKYLVEKISPQLVNSIVKPKVQELNFGRDPGAGIIREGIVANSRGKLLEKVSAKKKEIGNLINKQLTSPEASKKVIDITSAFKPVDEAMARAADAGEQLLYDRLSAVKRGLTNTFKEVDGKLVTSGAKPTKLSPIEARKLKTKIGEDARWTNQAFDEDVNQVRVAVYRNLNNLIDQAVPGTKKLNARFADMLTAENAMNRVVAEAKKEALFGGKDVAASVITGGAALAGGLANPLAAAATVAGFAGSKALKSTAFKTRAAKFLSTLSPEEMSLLQRAVPLLKGIYSIPEESDENDENQQQ